MIKNLNRFSLVVLLLLLSVVVWGQNYPKPIKGRMVHDFAKVLSNNEERALETRLRSFNDSTSTQMVIVTVKSLNGEDISQYATELGQEWGVGHKGKDNGVVILYKPKVGNSRGQIFIAVGYGLEGAIPDATASAIVNNDMIPYFQQGKTAAGLAKGVDVLVSLAKGEYTADDYNKSKKRRGGSSFSLIIFILFFILSMLIPRKRRGDNITSSGSTASDSILPWILIGMMGSGRSSGGYGGGGGFSSGGGFGGFGGGGFGGGGAGGSW